MYSESKEVHLLLFGLSSAYGEHHEETLHKSSECPHCRLEELQITQKSFDQS